MNAESLVRHWKEHGAIPRPACTQSEIAAFEAENRVKIPSDMKGALLIADGMSANAVGRASDDDGFHFWPLHEFALLNAEKASWRLALAQPDDYFIFADYMDWSWAYAIALRGSAVGTVTTLGMITQHVVARSFAEFIRAYMNDASELYPS